MRSQWRLWPDPMRISWQVPGGVGHVTYSLFAGARVEHDDGSWSPKEFTYVEMPTDAHLPYYVLECEYGDDLVPRIMSVQVVQRDPRREVRSVDLRPLRIEDALEEAWLKVTRRPTVVTDGSTSNPAEALSANLEPAQQRKMLRGLRAPDRRRITPDVHAEVARVYRANIASGAPVKAVAEHFAVATSTAFLYVRRARENGALEPREQSAIAGRAAETSESE